MNTLCLAQDTWDLFTDISGNIAMASDPYSIAQDVASAIRIFQGEIWYDTAQGIPYFERVLGRTPPLQYLRSQVEARALTVPGVVRAQCVFAQLNTVTRALQGQCKIIDITGAENNVTF